MVAITSEAHARQYTCRTCARNPVLHEEVSHWDWHHADGQPRCPKCWRAAQNPPLPEHPPSLFERMELEAIDQAVDDALGYARVRRPQPPTEPWRPAMPPHAGPSAPMGGPPRQRPPRVEITGCCLLCASTERVDRMSRVQMRNQPLSVPVVGPRCTRCTSFLDYAFGDVAEVIAEGRGKPPEAVDALADTWCGVVAVARRAGDPDPQPPPSPWGW